MYKLETSTVGPAKAAVCADVSVLQVHTLDAADADGCYVLDICGHETVEILVRNALQ